MLAVDEPEPASGDTAGHRPLRLYFDALSKIGLQTIRLEKELASNTYRPLDDEKMINLLIRTGRIIDRIEIQSCLVEAALNGQRIMEILGSGKRLVLRSPGYPNLTAPIPLFNARAKTE
ncbi:hypothetical protein QBK99_25110 [Corticibacterium sp. UT-5YL-CI-8]|nr:hypothetical protein [Tianweitania sp. UT-5YL-CI-8]